jgi:rRNA maturation endonuclease Nob1
VKYCYQCGFALTSGNEKFCPSCGHNLSQIVHPQTTQDSSSINITGTGGDVIGTGVSGSGNIIGKNIVVGSGTINISERELAKVSVPEYAEALQEFTQEIDKQLAGKQIPQDHVKEINQNLEGIVEEVKDVKKIDQPIGEVKKSDIKAKLFRIAKSVLKVLPKTAETIALFTPLAPFSKLIGEGSEYLVEAIQKEM